jgi:hypothetical protein
LDRLPTAKRLLDAGADRNDLVRVARAAAYEAVFTAVWAIDEGHDPDAPDDCPGWRLMETEPDCHPTGRVVGGLHESFQSWTHLARRVPTVDVRRAPLTCMTSRWVILVP